MKYIFSILIVFLFSYSATAQTKADSLTQSLPSLQELILLNKPLPINPNAAKNRYDVNKLPIFCKIEAKLEKKTNFPIFFRLGSKDYVDYLEGKNNFYSPK